MTCYKIGIGNGSAACVNDLGALYCMGDIVAHPAIRIANIIMGDDCESYGVERDFLRALALYQQAEIGLRIDIADGQMYYIKRLREAIDGQQRVRALLSPRHC